MSRKLVQGCKFEPVPMTKVQEVSEITTQEAEIIKSGLSKFKYKSRAKNPEWSVEKLIPLRSCLLHNNAESESFISNTPKWLTILEHAKGIDTGTGEIIYVDYETDDFKASKHRKIKTVEKFCNHYEPLYRSRKVSLLFFTFTRSDYARQDMRRMMDNVKHHLRALNWPILGYLWALELKANENMESGYHIHYHLVIATKRVYVTEIPEELKFEDLWGQRTGVEFIKRSVRGYLSKYLYKSDAKIIGKRAYSISRILK